MPFRQPAIELASELRKIAKEGIQIDLPVATAIDKQGRGLVAYLEWNGKERCPAARSDEGLMDSRPWPRWSRRPSCMPPPLRWTAKGRPWLCGARLRMTKP